MREIFQKYKLYGIKTFIRYALAETYYTFWMQGLKKSYSQHGEDLLIDKLLGFKKKGFYVDVGAYDPHRFSNTKKFYNQGWNGINIEPDVINFEKFVKHRKRDINLNLGIGIEKQKITFFRFFPDTLSTFSEESFRKYIKEGFRLVKKTPICVEKLSDVLSKYHINNEIDFLSVDTEGYDLEVLKSNDWNRFRPHILCVETTIPSGKSMKRNSEIEEFLTSVKYKKYADIGCNSIFSDSA